MKPHFSAGALSVTGGASHFEEFYIGPGEYRMWAASDGSFFAELTSLARVPEPAAVALLPAAFAIALRRRLGQRTPS